MDRELSRRCFIRAAAYGTAGLATLWGKRIAFADPVSPDAHGGPGRKPLYAFVVLGDLHYDRIEHHDMEWVQREKPKDIRQINGYVEVTAQHTPRLMQRVKQAIEASAVPVPFIIQIGDFVEGLCGSYDLQARQFNDAMAMVDDLQLNRPFLITKGNHDITGPGAPEAYEQVLLPWLSRQAGQAVNSANFVQRQDEDRFVFFDAYEPELDWLEGALNDEPTRHTFFVIHPPVVPYDARANWHVFARENQREQRARLLGLLEKHSAIVLGGHLHKYGLVERQGESGSIVQLAVNSIVRSQEVQRRQELAGKEQYGPELVSLEPNFSPPSLEERQAILRAEAPSIRRYEYADAPGFAVVNVFSDGVEVDVFAGVENQPWRSASLAASKEKA